MTKIASFLVVTLLSLLLGACAKSGQIHVTKSLDTKLDQFSTVHITATGATTKTNRAARKFEKMLGQRLQKAGVFEGVESSAGVVLRCKVTHMDFGDELKRELSLRGKAKATIEIRITEPDGALLGHITATAQTTKKNDNDQPAVRVLEMAADAVVDYLAERKQAKPAGKSVQKPAAPAEAEEEVSIEDEVAEENADEQNTDEE